MGASSYPGLAIPKGTPAVLAKGWKRRATQVALEAAYTVVNERDQNRSRVSGAFLTAETREHHHLAGRRVRPDWREDPNRIILCTRVEHKLLHAHAILVEGEDASQRLVFHWNRELVPVGKEPIKLISKRRSQR